MRTQSILFSYSLCLWWAFSFFGHYAFAETQAPNTETVRLAFTTNEILKYNYQTTQKTTQYINDDTIHIDNQIAWQFAIRCLSQNEQAAQLSLSILQIKASVKAPKFEHSIDTSLEASQVKTPVIGHLALLNGKTLMLTYDYQQQRVTALSGAEQIHAAFRRTYPKDQFSEEENPLYTQAVQQFSNQALLRIWSEILRPPSQGLEEVTLEAPLNLKIEREWQQPDANHVCSYVMKPYTAAVSGAETDTDSSTETGTETAQDALITLSAGPNPIQARLKQLEAKGQILVKDQKLSEAQGSFSAKMAFLALTTELSQDLAVEWRLLLVQRLSATEE